MQILNIAENGMLELLLLFLLPVSVSSQVCSMLILTRLQFFILNYRANNLIVQKDKTSISEMWCFVESFWVKILNFIFPSTHV